MRVLLPSLLLALSAPAAMAQTALPPAPWADRQLADPVQETQARELMESIRCLTCQSQSIADSNASMAADLRSEIRERIARGEKPEAIRQWLIERYGDWISYKPSAAPVLWPLWAAPVLLIGGGFIVALRRLRRRRTS